MTIWSTIKEAIFGPQWVIRKDENDVPKREGWYRVMVSGDSEHVDGYTIYCFNDYETFAFFTPHEEGGTFVGTHDEDNFMIYAYCGPIHIPPFPDTRE